MMQDPLYGLVVQSRDDASEKLSTKTISGINVPIVTSENKSTVGTDLDKIGGLLIGLMPGKTHTKTYLNSRTEVKESA